VEATEFLNRDQLMEWLLQLGLPAYDWVYFVAVVSIIALTSLLVHFVLHRVVLRFIGRGRDATGRIWPRAFFKYSLFTRLALVLQGVVVFVLAGAFLNPDTLLMGVIETVTHLWIILFASLALFSLLDALEELSRSARRPIKLPLRGLFQSLKLVASTIALIFAVAFLIGKSPLILFSGLGAMTAVVLLIFRDPLLGLVAGVQLSANNMLAVGDWLEMPKYGADGDVIDISLTTVKVRNWDKTITSIPSYALISDSFKNWRNIEVAGGRRIKRPISIDASSVRFASEEDISHWREADLLSGYIEDKLDDIKKYNEDRGLDPKSAINARALTNLGVFRAYLTVYLGSHASINKDLTYMVRQLDPTPTGIPLEIYGFANQTSWVPYENIQSDIFDHIYAVIPEFGLRLFQSPSGHDVQLLASLRPERSSGRAEQ